MQEEENFRIFSSVCPFDEYFKNEGKFRLFVWSLESRVGVLRKTGNVQLIMYSTGTIYSKS